jgi:hypothetical protein
VGRPMPMVSTRTAILIALVVTTTPQVIPTTLIKCKTMSRLKDQPKGCKNETSVKKPASSTKSTEMRHTYASLISMALDAFKDSKPKQN